MLIIAIVIFGNEPKTIRVCPDAIGEEFSELYKLGIKTACEKAGAYCERVDEQIFNESILAPIYNRIAKADIIVSDLTRYALSPLLLSRL